jgi:hypothetical protein
MTLSQNGTFKLCPADNDAKYARAVVISKTARVRRPKDSDGDGVYDDANGKALVCGEDYFDQQLSSSSLSPSVPAA